MLITLVGILVYAAPTALLWVWLLRIVRPEGEKSPRLLYGWSSLVLITFAVAVCWISVLTAPQTGTPDWDAHFVRWANVSITTELIGIVVGVVGSGRKRGVVIAAGVTVPLF